MKEFADDASQSEFIDPELVDKIYEELGVDRNITEKAMKGAT